MSQRQISFWITLLRGLFALSFGLLLLLRPATDRFLMVNFMGAFWLASGSASLLWALRAENGRLLPSLAGLVGIFAGLSVLGRSVTTRFFSFVALVNILAILILLVGVLHIAGGFRRRGDDKQERSWSSGLLGLIEIGLGGALLWERGEFGPALILAIGIWAVAGGVMLLGDAWRIRPAPNAGRQESAPPG